MQQIIQSVAFRFVINDFKDNNSCFNLHPLRLSPTVFLVHTSMLLSRTLFNAVEIPLHTLIPDSIIKDDIWTEALWKIIQKNKIHP